MLDRLKVKCEYIIVEALTVDNVCFYLVGAKKYGADQLKRYCLKYIKRHKEEVRETKGFTDLSSNSGNKRKEVLW